MLFSGNNPDKQASANTSVKNGKSSPPVSKKTSHLKDLLVSQYNIPRRLKTLHMTFKLRDYDVDSFDGVWSFAL